MKISIDKTSEVSIRRQIVGQVAFMIATGKARPGTQLPSVREVALRQKVHANTVSQAYQELVERNFVRRERGKRLVVRSPQEPIRPREEGLDDLIDAMIRTAQDKGYRLQQLRERVRERLLTEPPDHVLIVARERGLGRLLAAELSSALNVKIAWCLLEDLSQNPGLAIGALVACLPGLVWELAPLAGTRRPIFPLEPSNADDLIDRIERLNQPSMIALVSASPYVLQIAEGLLAPFAGGRHSLEQFCLAEGETRDLSGADLVFSDTLSTSNVRAPHIVHYRLVAESTCEALSRVFEPSAQE